MLKLLKDFKFLKKEKKKEHKLLLIAAQGICEA